MKFGVMKVSESSFDFEELFSYVNNSKKYRTRLETSTINGLWEYATLLIWKNIILFIYEKLFQTKLVGNTLPDDFNRQLNNGNVTVHSCFDFCCITDDNIYTNLHKIWNNVESNYKQMFKALLDDRNSLSHVNRYEEDFSEQWFKTYFEKSLRFLRYIQDLNNTQLSKKIYDLIENNTSIHYFSEKDINYLLSQEDYNNTKIINHILDHIIVIDYSKDLINKIKEEIIDSYLRSKSYDSAYTNGIRMIKLKNSFSSEDIKKILTGIFIEQKDHNQIIFSNKMDEIFSELLENSSDSLRHKCLSFMWLAGRDVEGHPKRFVAVGDF